MKTYDLEKRLISFAVQIINITELLPSNRAGKYLADQLVRSGLAPSLLYGEVQAAESRKDFIHKMSIALKELRESSISMQIIAEKEYIEACQLELVLNECKELIAIFTASLKTARSKM
jgi:four helix bundle protein